MSANGRTSRAREVADVAEDRRHIWLAAQIDEAEATTGAVADELKRDFDALLAEMRSLKRVLQGILISVIVALVAIPVGIIWTAATVRP